MGTPISTSLLYPLPILPSPLLGPRSFVRRSADGERWSCTPLAPTLPLPKGLTRRSDCKEMALLMLLMIISGDVFPKIGRNVGKHAHTTAVEVFVTSQYSVGEEQSVQNLSTWKSM